MGSRRQVWFVALVGVVVSVAAVLLVGHPEPADGQTPPLRIAVFGDSVLLGAKEELLAEFAGQQVTVDAVEDRSLLGTIGLFRSAGASLGDVVVLDLGYNDSSDPAVFRGRIDDAMTALAGVKRVIWLNQHDWGTGRAGMNAELAAAATRYPNLDVVDWNAAVAIHPEYVYADAIHLTPAGQPAMAAVVRDHVDRYVASLTPTTTATPSTAPATTGAVAAPARPKPAVAEAGGGGIDGRAVTMVVVGAVALLVVMAGAVIVRRRAVRRRRARRRAQRRVSSSARNASGSVTGSRQANRSHT